MLSVRTISNRNAHIYNKDKLFSIISENVDAVFMVYDCKAQRVESVSYTHLDVYKRQMPCTAKKDEQVRPEFVRSDGARDTDGVITTQEFASILKLSLIHIYNTKHNR